uniref:Vacuolar protein sorting-associated protein 18 homolog n=1 Tax=Cacopsylla melanoneura TaxID=428564 RepID=A0A8D8Y9F0_9HEMI
MTSIFDQYEQAFQKSSVPSVADKSPQVPTTGFVNLKLEDETPMFTKQKVNFAPTNTITHLVVGGNTIVLAMANNVLLRINLSAPDVLEEVKLPFKLLNLFMDPSGTHTIATLEGSEIVYLLPGSAKTKSLSKLKGNFITSMCWTPMGVVIFGTAKGDIVETEIAQDYNPYIKQLFTINKRIFDIHYTQNVDQSEESLVLVSTVDRIYTFQGYINKDKPVFSNMFLTYLSRPESFIQEKNSLKFSHLRFFAPKDPSRSKLYAWYVDRGLLIQELGSAEAPVLVETAPGVVSFILTEFHVLLLYPDHVTGVSLLSKQMVFEDYYNETHGRLVDIVKDSVKGRVWVIAESAVFRYKVVREDRHVWLMYTEQAKTEQDWVRAKAACQDNPANLDIVTQKQAQFNFSCGEYEASALLWARTQAGLETIALKFLQEWQVDALRTYLKKKLERIHNEDKAQITIIVMWVMELYLYELGELRSGGQESSEQYRILQTNLDIFLALPQVTEFINNHKTTVYDLISSHGDKYNLIKLTIATKDYERHIRHLIQEEQYKDALSELCAKKNPLLWQTFVPTLLQGAPKLTVDTIISHKVQLDVDQLLSSLMSCADETVQIRFLEYSIYSGIQCQLQSVHNFLVLLYARHNEDNLNKYLVMQGTDPSLLNYDVHYALRVCREYNRMRACVTICCVLGLWEAAVDLALDKLDVDVAMETASLPSVHEGGDLKRTLWLKIARHVISEGNDIKAAVSFLEEAEELISIEDILPFFSDFTCIDQFKKAICDSLEKYYKHIVDLKDEMSEATRSAEEVRNDIQACGNRFYIVQNSDVCPLCEVELVNNAFYIFPCGHKFHSRCMIQNLDSEQRVTLETLSRTGEDSISSSSTGEVTYAAQGKNKAVDLFLSRECPFCGSHMIELIDKPFINEEDIERIALEWE